MLIKKYKHRKNISNNIQIKQPTSSVLSDELTPATAPETEATCHNSAADLRHLFLKLYMSWYTGRQQKQQQQQQHHHYQQQEQQHHPRTRIRTRTTSMWCLSSVIVVLVVISLPLPPQCDAVGYSYTRFSGPVSGPEHRVYVRDGAATGQRGVDGTHDDHDEAAHLDYVAKPEYEFAYGVEDAQAHILHNRNEMRDGDAVKGVYSVVDPDGTLRVVKYTADDVNGFQAEVIMNGISAIHGQLQQDTPTTISHPNIINNNNHDDYNGYYQTTTNVYSPEGNSNYNHHYHPSYYYPTPVHQGNPSVTVHPSNYNNDNNNDYDDTQDYNNEGDYRPQYEVHERPNKDEEDDKEDGDDEHDGKDDKKKVSNGGKKKDYDDDDDDEGDDEGDDYDNSEELEDYDEAVKNHDASDESDEYY